jgi:predicted TPR repeat methyltransferase
MRDGLVRTLAAVGGQPIGGCRSVCGDVGQAPERGCYDELVQEDLSAFLQERPEAFDLLASGDTPVHIGRLEPVFAAAAQALRRGGALVSSVERHLGEPSAGGFQLNRFGRYVHEAAYVRQVLSDAGFDSLANREEVLRLEAGVPVPGLLVAARKL